MAILSVFARSIVILICVLTFAGKSHAADPIYVLVAQSLNAYNDNESATVFANRVENALNVAILSTGLSPSREIIAHPYLIPTLYISDNFAGTSTGLDALAYLSNGTDPLLSEARDTIVPFLNAGYDLIVMQIDSDIDAQPSSISCGWATTPADFNNFFNSENAAFIVIENHSYCSGIFGDFIVSHEFAHTLGADHQVIGIGPPGLNQDSTPTLPVSYNHPVASFLQGDIPFAITVAGSPGTLDSSSLFPQFSRSSTGLTLGNTGVPEGAVDKDMYRLIVRRDMGDGR